MLKKRKLYKIVQKLVQKSGKTIPPIKECTYEFERIKIFKKNVENVDQLKFYDEEECKTYFATAWTNISSGEITLYLGEELNGKLVCDTKYYGVQEDGTYCASNREYDEYY